MTMDDLPHIRPLPVPDSDQALAVTAADLHAWVDGCLPPERLQAVEQHLATHPEALEQVAAWEAQNIALRRLLDPVAQEAIPSRLTQRPLAHGARPRARPGTWRWTWQQLAASVLIALVSGGAAWVGRGAMDDQQLAVVDRLQPLQAGDLTPLAGFARRAAVAHVVYSPDVRRPVEVGAEQEDQLVAWLSRRLGTAVRAPDLHDVGYTLIGGRLLPGESGPVAQFMYHDAAGRRLTLYVSHELAVDRRQPGAPAFHFGQDGPVKVAYWVAHNVGYAVSGGAEQAELQKVSREVYRQLHLS